MKIKRPIIIFFLSFVVGIIFVNENFLVVDRILILSIAIFFIFIFYKNKNIDKKIILILSIVFLIGIGRFSIEKQYFDTIDKKIEKLNNKKQKIFGEVISIGKSTNSNFYILKNVTINNENYGKMRCYFSDEINKNAKIGNIISIDGKMNKQDPSMNFGQFNSQIYYRSMKENGLIYATDINIKNYKINFLKNTVYEFRKKIIENIYKIYNKKNAGLFTAMLTGDRSGLDIKQKKLFNENGIAHIIAISGLHLSILGMMLYELLRKKLSTKLSAGIVSVVILFYAIFIDASFITLRAIIMLYIRFLALSINRSYDIKNILFIVAFMFLLISPYLLFNAGFLFSYSAVLSLNMDFNIEIKKRTIKIPSVIILTIFLYPITIYNYFSYPTYSILLNLIVIPLMTFVLLFGIISLLGSFFNIMVAKFFGGIVHFILLLYEFLCEKIQYFKFNTIFTGKPQFTYIIIFYFLFFIIYILLKNKKEVMIKISKRIYKNIIHTSIMFFIFIIFLMCIKIKPDFLWTTLYVGQGDSLIFRNKNAVFTIDGGSSTNKKVGEYVITPYLLANQINNIDYSIITHADSDHTNGIIYILNESDNINIKNLILPIFAKDDKKYNEIKKSAKNKNVNITYMKQGDVININDVRLLCLSPDEENTISKNDINEQSLCIKISYNNKNILTTGDIGEKIENSLISNKKIKNYLRSDFLKVGHHGSRKSSSYEFLNNVLPKYSIISSGINNSYNHPHKETIERLKKINTKIYETAKCGEIDIFIKNNNVEIKKYRNFKN